MSRPKLIAVDFHGVIHSHQTPSGDGEVSDDPPVPGALEWLSMMVRDPRFKVAVISAKSQQEGGVEAMKSWLFWSGLETSDLERISFPRGKPRAWLTIDDRCMRFDGQFPDPDLMESFEPWRQG